MLRKSWGLTLVAGLAMTVVITIAAVAFDVLAAIRGTDLPLDEGDRIVALQSWDMKEGAALGTSTREFERWRVALRSVEDIGAFRTVERNLQTTESIESDRPAVAVAVAEVTASAFQVARVEPLLGRPLLAEDELASAASVLLIGDEVWHSRFASDPEILGRRVRLDGTIHTIVGVMPKDFGFPIFHRYWMPLRTSPSSYAPDVGGDDLVVFARLRPGATMQRAQSELRGVGRLPSPASVAEASAETGANEEIQLRVLPYATAFLGEVPSWAANLMLFLVTLLLIPPSVNIAILVYARTITRQGEFAARYVLGASRFNIVAQLFLEILVLAAAAGAVALVAARRVLRVLLEDIQAGDETVPFWMDFGSSPKTVLFVAGLAVLAAMIAGVVPALQATGRRMQSGLRSLGGHTRAQLGGVWTALIVLQVAFSFALLPTAVEMTWGTVRSGLLGPGFAADEYLTARLEMSPARSTGGLSATDRKDIADRFLIRQVELARVLTDQPGISAVTIASEAPGEGPWVRIETDETHEAAPIDAESPGIELGTGRLSRVNHVDEVFFEVFEIPILTGRAFDASDFDGGRNAMIVNRSFVENVLGEGNPWAAGFATVPSATRRPSRPVRTGGSRSSESPPTCKGIPAIRRSIFRLPWRGAR